MHHTDLHDSDSAYCEANNVLVNCSHRKGEKAVVLLAIQGVWSLSNAGLKTWTVVFHDDGATLSLCTHSWARKMGLSGQALSLWLKVVNKEYEQVETMEYAWKFMDNKGVSRVLYLVGLESITEESPKPCLDNLYAEFPETPRRSW